MTQRGRYATRAELEHWVRYWYATERKARIAAAICRVTTTVANGILLKGLRCSSSCPHCVHDCDQPPNSV
jgi:hypothetical protein